MALAFFSVLQNECYNSLVFIPFITFLFFVMDSDQLIKRRGKAYGKKRMDASIDVNAFFCSSLILTAN